MKTTKTEYALQVRVSKENKLYNPPESAEFSWKKITFESKQRAIEVLIAIRGAIQNGEYPMVGTYEATNGYSYKQYRIYDVHERVLFQLTTEVEIAIDFDHELEAWQERE